MSSERADALATAGFRLAEVEAGISQISLSSDKTPKMTHFSAEIVHVSPPQLKPTFEGALSQGNDQ